jgi:hypothetical protein
VAPLNWLWDIQQVSQIWEQALSEPYNFTAYSLAVSIQVAARSKAWVCGRSLAGIGASISARIMDVCLLLNVVLSGRGLCDGLITRPEESYLMWRVWMWSWSLDNEEVLSHWGGGGGVASLKNSLAALRNNEGWIWSVISIGLQQTGYYRILHCRTGPHYTTVVFVYMLRETLGQYFTNSGSNV